MSLAFATLLSGDLACIAAGLLVADGQIGLIPAIAACFAGFPEGKGQAKWHVPGDRLFLGIDHTAIVVEDTERSLRFYRDGLGLGVVGEARAAGCRPARLR